MKGLVASGFNTTKPHCKLNEPQKIDLLIKTTGYSVGGGALFIPIKVIHGHMKPKKSHPTVKTLPR